MNEQSEVVTTTLLDMLSRAGSIGMPIIILSVIVLISAPIFYFMIKPKRSFIIWVMSQNIKLNLITIPLIFSMMMFKSGMTTGGCFDFQSRLFGTNLVEALFGPTYILMTTFALFIMRFILMIRTQLRKEN